MAVTGFRDYVMAVERVEQRLRKVVAALQAAGIAYAVVGGNAVAAWVARVDPSATRATKDVDLLVRRQDEGRISMVMAALGYIRGARHDLRRMILYTDPDEPSLKTEVHLVWAEELLRPSYLCPAPSVTETVPDPDGFALLDLPALVRMKLTSCRDVDRVHIADLLSVGLIDQAVRAALPQALRERLEEIERSMDT